MANKKHTRTARRTHSAAFKQQVVEDVRSGRLTKADAQRKHNLAYTVLKRWLRDAPVEAPVAAAPAPTQAANEFVEAIRQQSNGKRRGRPPGSKNGPPAAKGQDDRLLAAAERLIGRLTIENLRLKARLEETLEASN